MHQPFIHSMQLETDRNCWAYAASPQPFPAIPHNDHVHPLQECLSPGLLPLTLEFKVLKAHLSAHICLLDMLEYVAVIITWALRGSRHFEPAAYSVWLQRPHRAELIIVSLAGALLARRQHELPKSPKNWLFAVSSG